MTKHFRYILFGLISLVLAVINRSLFFPNNHYIWQAWNFVLKEEEFNFFYIQHNFIPITAAVVTGGMLLIAIMIFKKRGKILSILTIPFILVVIYDIAYYIPDYFKNLGGLIYLAVKLSFPLLAAVFFVRAFFSLKDQSRLSEQEIHGFYKKYVHLIIMNLLLVILLNVVFIKDGKLSGNGNLYALIQHVVEFIQGYLAVVFTVMFFEKLKKMKLLTILVGLVLIAPIICRFMFTTLSLFDSETNTLWIHGVVGIISLILLLVSLKEKLVPFYLNVLVVVTIVYQIMSIVGFVDFRIVGSGIIALLLIHMMKTKTLYKEESLV